jgi:hypothetical protein
MIGGIWKNFSNVIDKIENLIRFWERFKLTLPGRIAIIKTLLVPQLNYLGCVLTPADRDIQRIQTALDTFALKGLPVSIDRRYLLPATYSPNRGAWVFSV